MSISRRSFLRTGTIAGIAAAALPLKALATINATINPMDGARAAHSGVTPVPNYPIDALSTLTRNAFYARMGEYFTVTCATGKTIKIQLSGLTDLTKGATGRECFALLFKGPLSTFLRQHTYSMNNTKLGDFDLFIVPAGRDAMFYYYTAIINRRYP